MDLKLYFAQALAPLLAEHLSQEEIEQLIEVPSHAEHGDLAFPCFSLAKVFRRAPQQIAQELVEDLDSENFQQVEVVGPYINVWLKREKIAESVVREVLLHPETYGEVDLGHGEVMTIDMSSPNIAKPMSMGHLRSTVIGESIARLAEKTHYQPIRINHLGDWGTQFGRLIVAYKKWGDEEKVRQNPIHELVSLYVKFHEVLEDNPDSGLDDEGRAAFKALEDGDAEMVALWKWFREESLKEFEEVYEQLNISFDSYAGESFYNDKMEPIVAELEESGITKIDQGATIVDLEAYDLMPALIKRTDGATLYMTRDLAAAQYRQDTYKFDKNVYVVGNEQTAHFKQLRAVLKEMGREWADDIIHVPFGLITLGGKKLSTRQGKVVELKAVLDEAVSLAYQQIEAKNPNLANKEEVAQQVGVGAVVFHDLQTERMNNFDFDLEEIVQFEGETGPYVQYTYARSMRILDTYGQDLDPATPIHLTDDYAWEIIKKLAAYPATVERAMKLYEPSVIAKYVIQLSQLFNRYYANVRILADDDQLESRIALVKAMTQVIKDGLGLLNVQAPAEM